MCWGLLVKGCAGSLELGSDSGEEAEPQTDAIMKQKHGCCSAWRAQAHRPTPRAQQSSAGLCVHGAQEERD